MTPSRNQPMSSRSVMLMLGVIGVPAAASLLRATYQANLQAKTTGHRPPSPLIHLPSPRHHPRNQLLRHRNPLRHHQSHPAEDRNHHHLLLTRPQPSPSIPLSHGPATPPRPSRPPLNPGIKQRRHTPRRHRRGIPLRKTRLCWLVSCLVSCLI